jgi:hypothetical protein
MTAPPVSRPPHRAVFNCPKCGSARVHRSRRHSILDHVLAGLGAQLRRCHDCRCRYAWFGYYPIPAADSAGAKLAARSLLAGGATGCLLALWWVIARTKFGAG